MAAIAISAGIMAATSIYAAKKEADAAKEAAKIQTDAGTKAIDFQKQMYEDSQKRMQPYQDFGNRQLQTLSGLMTPGSPGSLLTPYGQQFVPPSAGGTPYGTAPSQRFGTPQGPMGPQMPPGMMPPQGGPPMWRPPMPGQGSPPPGMGRRPPMDWMAGQQGPPQSGMPPQFMPPGGRQGGPSQSFQPSSGPMGPPPFQPLQPPRGLPPDYLRLVDVMQGLPNRG